MKRVIAMLVAASATIAADAAKLNDGMRVEFDAVLPNRQSLTISLGRGRERLEVSSKRGAYPWSFIATDGSDPRRRAYPGSSRPLEKSLYWWENCDYTPNGRYKRSFATSEKVADLSEAMQSERWQTADKRTLKLAVELSGGWLSFWIDDILLHALPATDDVAGREVKVTASKKAKVSEQRVAKVECRAGEWKVPFGNVGRRAGDPEPYAIDVGRSWTREASVDGYSAPNGSTFGGRWAGALSANGVTRLMSNVGAGPENSSYWGEQHYSGGASSRITMNPHPVLAANATMVRLLKSCEFVRNVPTPSLGVFAIEYRNVKTGEPLHVMWCIRGKVPVKLKASKAFDVMDNLVSVRELTPDPVFVLGLKGEIEFGRQKFAKAETAPAKGAVKVCSLGNWSQSTEKPGIEYLDNMPGSICRYPVEMAVESRGGRLSVTLPEGLPDRDAMPFVTTIVPPKKVVLPGRPRKIALDVDVVSADWGRVVYVLSDAKGEKFVSVGQRRTYNVDDTKCDSFFNFDGRRLVRFELPGSRPWDLSRYPGNCWWGSYGGDGIVDYPLSVEKIYVERRAKAMHVNDVVKTKRAPVSFGSLYVEDVEPDSDLAMPCAENVKRQNPLAEIDGTLPPTEITAVKHPLHYYDGTRGHFSFREMEGAASYDVYVSLSPAGDGAILLKKGVKKSGELVTGFLAGRENYGFVVWRDAKGAVSKPSAPFKFLLNDEFAEK